MSVSSKEDKDGLFSDGSVDSSISTCKEIDDKTIADIRIVRPKHFLLRYDTTPFFILYAIFYSIHASATTEWWSLFGLIALPVIFFFHIIVALLGYWSIPLRMKIGYVLVPLDDVVTYLHNTPNMETIRKREFRRGMEIVTDRFQKSLASYEFYKQLHVKKVEIYTKNYEKMISQWNPASGRPKPQLKLPTPPLPPTVPLPPFTMNGDILSIAIIPITNYGSPMMTELQLDNGVEGYAYGVVNPTTGALSYQREERPVPPLVFSHHYHKYVLAANQKKFISVQYPDNGRISQYLSHGPLSEAQAKVSASKYGANTLTVPIPSFLSLLAENAMAPFFVFQIFCVSLWMLDEYWYYSLFTLCMLVMMECMVVYRRLSHLNDMLGPKPPLPETWVCRENSWKKIPAEQLVPGDIFLAEGVSTLRERASAASSSSSSSSSEAVVNASDAAIAKSTDITATVCCDCLLLDGVVVVDEAVLTGESVPQVKEDIKGLEEEDIHSHQLGKNGDSEKYNSGKKESEKDAIFQMIVDGGLKKPIVDVNSSLLSSSPQCSLEATLDSNIHKRHMLFSGTQIIGIKRAGNSGNSEASSSSKWPTPPVRGAVAVVTRTGFGSIQGSLVRTILTSSNSVAADFEALAFIGVLLIVAIIAAYHVLVEGLADVNRSRYKLLLNVIMILTSVVPPELPMQLSMAVNNVLMTLAKARIFCTEPHRIPMAGAVDVVCFDKTGTLTADAFDVAAIVPAMPTIRTNATTIGKSTSIMEDNTLLPIEYGSKGLLTANAALTTVIAGCHELSVLDDNDNNSVDNRDQPANNNNKSTLIGDPLEAAAFTASDCHFTHPIFDKDCVSTSFGDILIHHRYAFESAKQRMSAIIAKKPGFSTDVKNSEIFQDSCLAVVTKGAPEMVYSLLHPDHRPPAALFTKTCDYLAKKGLRVLALAWRPLYSEDSLSRNSEKGMLSEKQLGLAPSSSASTSTSTSRSLRGVTWSDYSSSPHLWSCTQQTAETDLHFAGLLAFSSPLKRDSANVVHELQQSGHRVIMITGDHAITAVSVARELNMVNKPVKTLVVKKGGDVPVVSPAPSPVTSTSIASSSSSSSPSSASAPAPVLYWLSDIDDSLTPFNITETLSPNYDYCLTGPSLHTLTTQTHESMRNPEKELETLGKIFLSVSVFARASPKDKEMIIRCLRAIDCVCIMCGDGTNDVGALRQAQIGIALLSKEKNDGKASSNTVINPEMDKKTQEALKRAAEDELITRTAQTNTTVAMVVRQLEAAKSKGNMRQYEMLRKQVLMLCENGDEVTLKPGDASIAAPFTAKHSSAKCVTDLLIQGRCALVTTMQMYQILAVNCLISAYHMSALFLKGVKAGETQLTIQGLVSTACFFMLSRGTPLTSLHPQRPYAKIFSKWMLLTVSLQFLVHFVSLKLASDMAEPYIDATTVPGILSLDDDAEDNGNSGDNSGDKVIVPGINDDEITLKQWENVNKKQENDNIPENVSSSVGTRSKTLSLEDLQKQLQDGVPSVDLSGKSEKSEKPEKSEEEEKKPGSFVPNVLNTTLYLVQTAMTAATFLANYRGWPFMTPLQENSALYKTLFFTVLGCAVCALEIIPELNEMLELVPLPNMEYSLKLCGIIVADVAITTVIGQVLMRVFALGPKFPAVKPKKD